MTEIKSNITCTRCGKDILYCTCENSPNVRIKQLEKENAELSKALEESENREKELCILAENQKAKIKRLSNIIRSTAQKIKDQSDLFELFVEEL